MNNLLLIALTEAKVVAEKEKTLKSRLRAAMKCTKNHWMVTNDDLRFQAAVGAVLAISDEQDADRIKTELAWLKALSAAQNGVPVNFSELSEIKQPVGLVKLWQEAKSD